MKAWIRMPLELLQRQGLSKSAAIVLGVIIDRCTDTPSGSASMSLQDLARTSGYSLSTVKRSLIELEALELIQHDRTGRSSAYTLTGCVELLPPKQRGTRKAQARSEREAAQLAAQRQLDEYAALSNHFKEADIA